MSWIKRRLEILEKVRAWVKAGKSNDEIVKSLYQYGATKRTALEYIRAVKEMNKK